MKNTASLSTKLMRIGAALLVVALISIGLTLWVTWKLGGGAAALNEAGRMRMQTWRLASAVQAGLPPAALQDLVGQFDQSVATLRQGDPERPLAVPWDNAVRQTFTAVETLWHARRAEVLQHNVPNGAAFVAASDQFVYAIDQFVSAIEHQLAGLTAILNLAQIVMMALAIAAAVIMLYTGYLYVINPLVNLRLGLRQLESGQFATRVEVASNDEFGQVAAGFNRMAATLQSLYGNLEAQVEAKTRRIAAQKERLEALYHVSTALAEANTLEDLTRNFSEQVRTLMKADALALRWFSESQSKILILATSNFPATMQEEERCLRAGACACGNVQTETRARIIPILSSDIAPLQHCARHGYQNLISVPVRLQNKALGEIDLFFKSEAHLSAEEFELMDTLASHLASAVEGLRAAALDREAAVSGERTLLARELHDSIAQSLAFLKIQVQLLRNAMQKDDAGRTTQALDELDNGLKESIADVRELLVHFRTRAHSDEIETSVRETLQKFQLQTGLPTSSNISGDGLPLAPDVRIQVLHVLQEALSNVRKHADAHSVRIDIERGAQWRFAVCDDGRGFDAGAHNDALHVGMKIMRERAAQIGARLDLESRPGHGTVVRLVVPTHARVNSDEAANNASAASATSAA